MTERRVRRTTVARTAPKADVRPRASSVGTAGNVSGRLPDGTVVHDAVVDALRRDDRRRPRRGRPRRRRSTASAAPTSEKALHLACYRAFDEVGGVVHCHPPTPRCSPSSASRSRRSSRSSSSSSAATCPSPSTARPAPTSSADEVVTHLTDRRRRADGQPRHPLRRQGPRRRPAHRPSSSSTTPASSGAPRPSAARSCRSPRRSWRLQRGLPLPPPRDLADDTLVLSDGRRLDEDVRRGPLGGFRRGPSR